MKLYPCCNSNYHGYNKKNYSISILYIKLPLLFSELLVPWRNYRINSTIKDKKREIQILVYKFLTFITQQKAPSHKPGIPKFKWFFILFWRTRTARHVNKTMQIWMSSREWAWWQRNLYQQGKSWNQAYLQSMQNSIFQLIVTVMACITGYPMKQSEALLIVSLKPFHNLFSHEYVADTKNAESISKLCLNNLAINYLSIY